VNISQVLGGYLFDLHSVFQSDGNLHCTVKFVNCNFAWMSFGYKALMLYVQVAPLSQGDRAAEWISCGQKSKTGIGRQYLKT